METKKLYIRTSNWNIHNSFKKKLKLKLKLLVISNLKQIQI